MPVPAFNELSLDLQKVLDPTKEKAMAAIARGVAPLPAPMLVQCWAYLLHTNAGEIGAAARKSLSEYPEKMLLGAIKEDFPTWLIDTIGRVCGKSEAVMEAVLLHAEASNDFFLETARVCSEKFTILIANNQERLIECPEIIVALEENPNNLKSSTGRLRHFLQLAGVFVPGSEQPSDDSVPDPSKLPETKEVAETATEESADEAAKRDMEVLSQMGSKLDEEQKLSLLQFISKLNVGGRVKLAQKGNKEARQILIRDTNRVVALAVLKSPRITDNEIAFYSSLRSVCEDVIRTISNTVTWTKNYPVKYALSLHPKTPLQQSMGFIKFLNMRDLSRVSKERGIPAPLKKAAKELLQIKRK